MHRRIGLVDSWREDGQSTEGPVQVSVSAILRSELQYAWQSRPPCAPNALKGTYAARCRPAWGQGVTWPYQLQIR